MIGLISPADAEACLRIYAPFVEHTTVSLETSVPSVEAFAARISCISSFYPFLVWKQQGEVLGYASAKRYRDRSAYDWICESAIYVSERARGQGIGKQLYLKLFDCLRAMNLVSVVGVTRSESASAEFHRHMGFAKVGRVPLAGFKLGQWCDVEFWQYPLFSPPPSTPLPVIPFPSIAHMISFDSD